MIRVHQPREAAETMDEPGAQRLAAAIEAYWARVGRPVSCRVEAASMRVSDHDHKQRLFVVRSGLGLHLPPRVTP